MTAVAYARSCTSTAARRPDVASPGRPVRLVVVRTAAPGYAQPAAAVPEAVYRRRRVAATLVLVALLVSAWLGLGALGVGPLTGPERASRSGGVVYVVEPGDTLWSIARRIQPEGDLRPVVDRLVAAHGGATLQVGERLVLSD